MPHGHTGEKMPSCLSWAPPELGVSGSQPPSDSLLRPPSQDTLASLCLCGPGMPFLSPPCVPLNPYPTPILFLTPGASNNKLERTGERQPCSNSLSPSKEMPQLDTKVPFMSSSPTCHPLEEGKDKPGPPASAAPLFRTAVFISMVTSELPATGFLITLVMEFPCSRSGSSR